LIGTFVGDALGMPFEGKTAVEIREEEGAVTKMREARLGRGTYTDDTQMMMATADHLCQRDRVDRSELAQTYLEYFNSQRGYGYGTRQVFSAWEEGIDPDEAAFCAFDDGSYGNGGAMRIAPVGVRFYHDLDRLIDAVGNVVSLTHAHPLGLGGALVQARTVSLMIKTSPPCKSFYPQHLNREPAFRILDELEDSIPERWNPDGLWFHRLRLVRELLIAHESAPDPAHVASELGCSSLVYESVPTALFASLVHMDSFEDALAYAVEIGGDTDTIGAMTGAQMGGLYGVGHVPARWWDALENGDRGRDYLIELGKTLASAVPEVLSF